MRAFLRLIGLGMILAALLLIGSAVAEVTVTLSPASVRVGDYVDVQVTSDRAEAIQSITYQVTADGEKVFKGEKDTHLTSAYRPRTEGEHVVSVTVSYGKKDTETASATLRVAGFAPVQQGPDVVYSQKDGWWKNKKYAIRSVQKAGCALFALSHALQRMGYTEEAVLPDQLAIRYKGYYIEGRGTATEQLLRKASETWDFMTQDELDKCEKSIAAGLRRGDYYSLMVVTGHIALADGISEDGTKVHIIDSAPGATYERIKKSVLYYRNEAGEFIPAETPDQMPGLKYFFETGEYGGMTYWLDLSYCAKQGMRMIRPGWLKLETAEGARTVTINYFGAMMAKVILDGEAVRIPTRDLSWNCVGADGPRVALITRSSGADFIDGNGKKISGFVKIRYGTMLPVLEVTDDEYYILWKDTFGYISRKDATLLAPAEGDFPIGLVSLRGKTAGASTVNIRTEASAKSKILAEWKIGTPVAVVEQKGTFYLVEGKGVRGWIEDKYLTLDGGANDGQTVNEGK